MEKAEDDLDAQSILSFRALGEGEAKLLAGKKATADASKKAKSKWSWFSSDAGDKKVRFIFVSHFFGCPTSFAF